MALLVYAYDGRSAAPAPELAPPAGLAACSEGYKHTAALSAAGAALCAGDDSCDQLGTGGGEGRRARFAPAPLPWAAGQIGCGSYHTLALQRGGGAVCSWGGNSCSELGRSGAAGAPGAVQGLPEADPVAAVAAGSHHNVALTQGGAVYGWGCNSGDQLGLGSSSEQQPVTLIAGLSACGARRIAAGYCLSAAETGGGALLCAGRFALSDSGPTPPAPLPAPAVSGPLRALAAACTGSADRLAAADAQGAVWLWTSRGAPTRAALPPEERAAQIALSLRSLVALTEGLELWDCTDPAACRSISAAGALPRELVPCGGAAARRILLVPLSGPLGEAGQPAAGGGAAAEQSAAPGAAAAAQCAECAALRGELAALRRQLEERDAEAQKAVAAVRADGAARLSAAEAELAEQREAGARAAAEAAAALAEQRATADRAAAEAAAALSAAEAALAEQRAASDRAAAEAAAALTAAEAALAEQRAAGDRAAAEAAAAQRAAAERAAEEAAAAQAVLELQLADARERLAAAEVAATVPCSPVRRYFDPYAEEFPARSPAQVDAMNLAFLLQCVEIPGAGAEKEFVEMHAFLTDRVDTRIRALRAKGADFGGLSEAAVRMTHYWSANDAGCATFEGQSKEFCAWMNLALVYTGSHRPLRRAMPVIRTLNEFCVTVPKERDGSPVDADKRYPGPAMDKIWVKIRDNYWTLFRGGGLPTRLKDWFTPGLVFRQPRYLSASLNQGVAMGFAMREGTKDGFIPVLWAIEIDKVHKCCHINHLSPEYSFYPEDELLFAPRSVFTVKAVSWAPPGSDDPSRITLCAAPDSKGYPLDLPAAPWS